MDPDRVHEFGFWSSKLQARVRVAAADGPTCNIFKSSKSGSGGRVSWILTGPVNLATGLKHISQYRHTIVLFSSIPIELNLCVFSHTYSSMGPMWVFTSYLMLRTAFEQLYFYRYLLFLSRQRTAKSEFFPCSSAFLSIKCTQSHQRNYIHI